MKRIILASSLLLVATILASTQYICAAFYKTTGNELTNLIAVSLIVAICLIFSFWFTQEQEDINKEVLDIVSKIQEEQKGSK